MKTISLFLINQKDNIIFNFFTKVIVILVALFGCYIIIKNSNEIRKRVKINKKINFLLGSLLIAQQIFLTIQNIFLGKNNIFDLFPLYISRLSIIFLATAILSNKNIIKNIACYLSVFIGFYSIIFNNLIDYPYVESVFNNLGYVLMIWVTVYFISSEKFKLEKTIIKNILIFLNSYTVCLVVLINVMNNNYNIINGKVTMIYEVLPKGSYIVFSLILLNLAIVISHFLIKFILWEIDINFKLQYKTIIEKDKFNRAELE